MNKNYDLIVIGWGKAGKTLAAKYAATGKKVAMIEKNEKMYGGTCINVGCLPTKSLTHSSKLLEQISKFGIERDYDFNNSFFKKSIAKKDDFVAKLRNKNFDLLDKNENIDTYLANAKFLNDKEIEITKNDNEKLILTADKILINTGAVSRKLDVKGEDNINVLTSDEILDLKQLPKKLLIIGAGFIGLEFASYFSNFGTEVSIFQFDNNFLAREDEDDAEIIKETLEKKGIKFSFNTSVKEFLNSSSGVDVLFEKEGKEETANFDKVLVAVGRRANTDNLGLENTNIEINKFGEVIVDKYLRTTVQNIWAAGDVKGGPLFTYISLDDSRIILSQFLNIENDRNIEDRRIFATSTFIDPPYARVGLNEKEAKKNNIAYTRKYALSAAIPKAHVLGETTGFTKILLNENDEIIGATIFNYEAHEMINILSLAIKLKIKSQILRDFIYTHPTMTESLNDILN